MRKFVALVPMKSKSERVKNKNIKDMCGMPLFYYILKSLEKSKFISKIYVNTDSDIIKKHISDEFKNVYIIDRPHHLQGNNIPMNKIIEYDLSQIEGDYFLQTHSTNPLLKSKSIDSAIQYFLSNKNYDSLFTVTKIQKRFYDLNLNPINHDPKELINTQELTPLLEENSCIYIFTKNSFNKNKNRIGDDPCIYEIDKIESIDIDDEFDFQLVKSIMNSI